MKEKGFTLIELLAVIVILAIIALIAVPIVVELIDNSMVETEERSMEQYATAVKNAVALHQLAENKLPTSFDDLQMDYTNGEIECGKKKLYSDGTFYLEDCIINDGENKYTYGTDVCTIEKQNTTKYSVGDVLTCKIDNVTEKFYVIQNASLTSETIQVLPEYNISSTTNRQANGSDRVPFSSTAYWLDESGNILNKYSNYYVYDENNDIVKPIIDKYLEFLGKKIPTLTAKLMTYQQASNLGCKNYDCSNAPSWVVGKRYWLGGTPSNMHKNIWLIGPRIDDLAEGIPVDFLNNVRSAILTSTAGVRPVITIPTSIL